jgi:murein DD-endopeptidase MepM/ murein hydrolase activator NlpD
MREAQEAAAAGLRPRERKAAQRKAAKSAQRKAVPRQVGRGSVRPSIRRDSVLPLKRPRFAGRVMLTKLMSFSAMVGVAGMLVATSIPANAFYPSTPELAETELQQHASVAEVEVQSLGVDDTPEAAKIEARDSYTVESLADQMRGKFNATAFTFTNNPNGTIQWPFAVGVPISSGYGARVACSYCSSNHMGVDFTPGAGAPIQAIADGVVRDVIPGGAYGVHVIIDHEINGQKITSMYAHMRWGSPAVAAGQVVSVGQYLGDVGSTGNSTGAHLHLEIFVNDVNVDPFAWLKANAN